MRFENQSPSASPSFTRTQRGDETARPPRLSAEASPGTLLAGISWLTSLAVDGLAAYGEAMYPSFFELDEHVRRRNTTA